MTPVLYAIAAALGNLAGAFAVVRKERRSLRFIETSLAFGAGFMVALVLVGVLPEVFSGAGAPLPSAGLLVLAGYVLVHIAQHVLTPHFHFGEETHTVSPRAGDSALIGLGLHAFFDGVAIASGFMVSDTLGRLVFLAVVLHKLPEGVTIASLMLASGRDPGPALAAGVTLYVAASNLVPEFQAVRGVRMTAAFLGGAAALLLLGSLTGSAM